MYHFTVTQLQYSNCVSDDDEGDEEFDEGSSSDTKRKGKVIEEEYEDNVQAATVTVVEDFDADALIHGLDHLPENSQLWDDDEDKAPLDRRRGKYVVAQQGNFTKSTDHKSTTDATKAEARTVTKTKIKYQTNAARKMERMKQRHRKTEKAERAGGKASRKRKMSTRRK